MQTRNQKKSKREKLRKELARESRLVRNESMAVLKILESLQIDD